jgi:hypothetical protein
MSPEPPPEEPPEIPHVLSPEEIRAQAEAHVRDHPDHLVAYRAEVPPATEIFAAGGTHDR